MILIIESIILCILFTLMAYMMSKNPIKYLYDYPQKIQERVKSLDEYKDKIPTQENKLFTKGIVSVIAMVIFSLILKYVNGYTTFIQGFKYSFILWSVVNIYDVIVMDIIWFCHSKKFVIKGTEDMVDAYHDYWFHIKGGIVGEILGLVVCLIVGALILVI